MESIIETAFFIGKGVWLTLSLFVMSFILSWFLGSIMAISLHYKKMIKPIKIFISIFRGTPLILQLSFFYFVIPRFLFFRPSLFWASSFALALNGSAYVTEILRSGLESLPIGQFEAIKSLYIPRFYAWKDLILPQVIRNVFPSITNYSVALIKETSLISILGGMDITRLFQVISARDFTYFVPLCIAGSYYYILVILIEFFSDKIGKKFYVEH